MAGDRRNAVDARPPIMADGEHRQPGDDVLSHRSERERQLVGSDDADPAGAEEHAATDLTTASPLTVGGGPGCGADRPTTGGQAGAQA